MTALRRWALVALVAAVLVAAPLAWRLLPAEESDLGAVALYALVDDAGDQPYTGYVETSGTLQLPVSDRFRSIGDLFGDSTRLRVWWRDRHQWRVSQLHTGGETSMVHNGELTTEYDYEVATSTTSYDPRIRLPRTSDLLPPEVARRLLGGDAPDSLSRLPARRVAGISAAGLRVEGGAGRSSIGHVDLWLDPDTWLPLRVEVFARGSSNPDFTSAFIDFSTDEPTGDEVTFRGTEAVERTFDDVIDIADAANQFAPFSPPETIAGLDRSLDTGGAVGVYGEGLTQVLAIPVRDREADPLRDQIRSTPGSVDLANGATVSVGPLGVLLSGREGESGWLVTGTVTRAVLDSAAADLRSGTVTRDDTVFGGAR
ncbi:MAG: hypothetical protein ABWX84_02380 [Nocardioides sp.]